MLRADGCPPRSRSEHRGSTVPHSRPPTVSKREQNPPWGQFVSTILTQGKLPKGIGFRWGRNIGTNRLGARSEAEAALWVSATSMRILRFRLPRQTETRAVQEWVVLGENRGFSRQAVFFGYFLSRKTESNTKPNPPTNPNLKTLSIKNPPPEGRG